MDADYIPMNILSHYQMTNFRLFQTERVCRQFKLTKMAESYPNGLKTLWEKEKLLVTSNFSCSHSVFKRLVSQRRQKVSLCGNGLFTYFIFHLITYLLTIYITLYRVMSIYIERRGFYYAVVALCLQNRIHVSC